jgi:DNA-binding MarR family transcriptional regulator
LFDVFALGQEVRTLLGAAMRDAGLRADEYAVYSVVFEARTTTLTLLARTLGMPVTTAADYLRSMSARGHIQKSINPSDQRSHLLALTAAGKRAHQRANRSFERAYQAVRRELPPLDEGEARHLLQALAACVRRATATVEASR